MESTRLVVSDAQRLWAALLDVRVSVEEQREMLRLAHLAREEDRKRIALLESVVLHLMGAHELAHMVQS